MPGNIFILWNENAILNFVKKTEIPKDPRFLDLGAHPSVHTICRQTSIIHLIINKVCTVKNKGTRSQWKHKGRGLKSHLYTIAYINIKIDSDDFESKIKVVHDKILNKMTSSFCQ